MLQWETKNALVVRIFILLPILLLTGSNNMLNDLPQSVISEQTTRIPENLAKQGISGQNKEK